MKGEKRIFSDLENELIGRKYVDVAIKIHSAIFKNG